MLKKYTFDGSRKLDLGAMNTGAKEDKVVKEEIVQKTTVNQLAIQALQDKLYADQKEGLIILIQARDAAGKDSTIKHVMSGINPQGVDVYSFKQPTSDELAHDFLWRVNRHIPRRGKIAIYNRSYYEDVLVVQVRNLHQTYMMPKWIVEDPKFFQKRYKQIRHYEKYLHQNGYRVVKIFLNVSKKTQKERFLERIEDPDKNWKFSESDLKERKLWDQYTQAYEDAINATASKTSPWYVIPADKKWYTRYLVSQIVRKAMEEMDPQYPAMPPEQKERLAEYKAQLEEEDGPKDRKKSGKDAKPEAVNALAQTEKDTGPTEETVDPADQATGRQESAPAPDLHEPTEHKPELQVESGRPGVQDHDTLTPPETEAVVPAATHPVADLSLPDATAVQEQASRQETTIEKPTAKKPAASGRRRGHSRHRKHKGRPAAAQNPETGQEAEKKKHHFLKKHHGKHSTGQKKQNKSGQSGEAAKD